MNARLFPGYLLVDMSGVLDDLQLNPEEWTRPAALEFERVANRRRDLRGTSQDTRDCAHLSDVVRICHRKISQIWEG